MEGVDRRVVVIVVVMTSFLTPFASSSFNIALPSISKEFGLDAITMDSLEKDLRTIDAVIASCRDAVRRDPKNVEARVYLLGAYKGKVEFLDNLITAKKKSAASSGDGIVL